MTLQRFFASLSMPELTMPIAFIIAMYCSFKEKFAHGKALSAGM
ncbi:hypothetical protein [Kosakonia sacchari]|nr:hypothetical protein [Kosakonia sacchari]